MQNSVNSSNVFLIDGSSLTLQNLDDFFNSKNKLDLTPEAWQKVRKSRDIIQKMMSCPNRVVYGINTGFGNFADKIITVDQRKQLQINLVTSHAVGVGEPLPLNTSRRMMLFRINTLAKGRSGISPENVRRYLDAFNKIYIPMIPEKGTVGASGDLAPLSHLAVGMLGQGLAWDSEKNEYGDAGSIMKKLDLQPIDLHEKQGLALINGTQFMTSILSEVLKDTQRVLESSIVVLAFSLEIFGVDHKYFQDKFLNLYEKTNPSLFLVMKKVSAYFDKQNPSKLHMERTKTGKQNNRSHSVLQACQALAAVHDSLQICKKLVEEEMNSTTDNPLVFSKEDGFAEDHLISAGNFHGEYVAKSSDFIGMALFAIGQYSQARIQRYINERFSNLPSFLINKGGLNSGFMIAQYTSAALLSESKVLVKPASVDSIPTSASQEDHVSMGGFAARKSRMLLDNMAFIVGIELMTALQSIDLLKDMAPSKKLAQIHQKVREDIPYLQSDQFFGPKITVAHDLVMKGLNRL